jgi:hypothetical protein
VVKGKPGREGGRGRWGKIKQERKVGRESGKGKTGREGCKGKL